MDFGRAISTILGQFQRLSAILILPFGWPQWLVQPLMRLSFC